jgi:hypothetical protein
VPIPATAIRAMEISPVHVRFLLAFRSLKYVMHVIGVDELDVHLPPSTVYLYHRNFIFLQV